MKLYHIGSPDHKLMGTFTNKKWLYDALRGYLVDQWILQAFEGDDPGANNIILTSYCKLSADLRASDTAYVTDKETGEKYKVREVEGNTLITKRDG